MNFNLPPLEVEGESSLEVFTHSSIRREEDASHRMAFLGEMLLNLAIVRHWYEKSVSLQELQEKKDQSLSDELLQACIEKYQLQSKLMRTAEYGEIDLKDCRDFLNVYIGALYEQSSISGVQRWVSRLIDPDGEVPYSPLDNGLTEPSVTTPFPPAPPTAPPPAQTPPPLPPYSPPPNTGNGSTSSDRITLSIFNEYAQKRGHAVTFEANHSGEAHRLIWTIRCLVDGVEKGAGLASKQKEAKERAVREAWNAMGWDAPGASVNSPQPVPQVLSPISPTISLQNHSSLFAATESLPVPLEYVTVAAFNETATKQRYKISWTYETTGDPHMPNWKMNCMLNNEVKGTGCGNNKKEAMLQAVRDAWQSMGWS
ncbi:hypothetical protein APHAL10511_003187 [Amanita phalloides]|nr:hypothetical protein APHAL10511_003187 [Amanita phalloides]